MEISHRGEHHLSYYHRSIFSISDIIDRCLIMTQ